MGGGGGVGHHLLEAGLALGHELAQHVDGGVGAGQVAKPSAVLPLRTLHLSVTQCLLLHRHVIETIELLHVQIHQGLPLLSKGRHELLLVEAVHVETAALQTSLPLHAGAAAVALLLGDTGD